MSGPDGRYGQPAYRPDWQAAAPKQASRPDPAKLLGLAVAGLGGLNFIWGFLPQLKAPRIDADLSVFAVGPAYVPILLLIAGLLAMAAFLPGSERSRLAVAAVSVGGAVGAIVSLGMTGPVELVATGQVSKGLGRHPVGDLRHHSGGDRHRRIRGGRGLFAACPGTRRAGRCSRSGRRSSARVVRAGRGGTVRGGTLRGNTFGGIGATARYTARLGAAGGSAAMVAASSNAGAHADPGAGADADAAPEPDEAVTGPQVVIGPEFRRDGESRVTENTGVTEHFSGTGGVPGRHRQILV